MLYLDGAINPKGAQFRRVFSLLGALWLCWFQANGEKVDAISLKGKKGKRVRRRGVGERRERGKGQS